MAQPQPSFHARENPLHKGLETIKNEIDKILSRMNKEQSYMPERKELDRLSARALDLIQKHHPEISKEQKLLLNALVDLTEIPVMHPKMQKVAYQTALKEASKNLDTYLSC